MGLLPLEKKRSHVYPQVWPGRRVPDLRLRLDKPAAPARRPKAIRLALGQLAAGCARDVALVRCHGKGRRMLDAGRTLMQTN